MATKCSGRIVIDDESLPCNTPPVWIEVATGEPMCAWHRQLAELNGKRGFAPAGAILQRGEVESDMEMERR